MAARDIRRESGDVRPDTFVRPGVQNNAIGEAIAAIGGGIMAVDTALSKEKLGRDLDKARSEFLVGEMDDKPAGDPELEAQVDKELAPLRSQLQGLKSAEGQGILRGDVFKMRADAILQAAIARRPGLAPEYRQIHAEFTGGAIIEKLMAQEQAEFDAAKRAMGDKAKAAEDAKKFQLQQLSEAGFSAEAGALAYASPEQVHAEYMKHFTEIQSLESTKRRSGALQDAAKGVEAGYTLDRPQSLQTWQARYDEALQGVAITLRKSPAMLAQADEQGFAAMIGEWQAGVAQVKAELEAKRAQLGLKPDDVAGQMQVLKDMEEKGMKLLDGTVDLAERKRRVETFKYRIESMLQQDSPLTAAIVTLEERGAHNMVKWMYENNALLARQQGQEVQRFFVEGMGDPTTVTSLAGGLAQNTLKDMFPNGVLSKDQGALLGGARDLVNLGKAFIVTPSDKLKAQPFVEWVEEMAAFREPLMKLLPAEQKKELADVLRMSAHKLIRAGYLSLVQQSPTILPKIMFNPEPSAEAIVAKPGAKLTEIEAAILDQANQQLDYPTTLVLLKDLGGWEDPQQAHNAMLKSTEEIQGQMALAASERFERAKRGEAGRGLQGGGQRPAVGAVEDGWRYVGGDPASPSSWEKVE